MDSVGGYGGLTCFNKKCLITRAKSHQIFTQLHFQQYTVWECRVCGLLKVRVV